MTFRYTILCFFVLVVIGLLAFKNYETWTVPFNFGLDKSGTKRTGTKPDAPKTSGDQKEPSITSSIASYIFISEKNPFHPDRKEFPIVTATDPSKTAGAEAQKAVVRPHVTLYGVTIVDNYQSAFVSYPGRALQKGERETITVKIGDRIGDFKLAKILPDRIALEAPGDSFEVLLYDATTPKKRVYAKTENKPAAVVSTAPGAPGAAPEPGQAAAQPARPAVQPAAPKVAEAAKAIPATTRPTAPSSRANPTVSSDPASSTPGAPTTKSYPGSRLRRYLQQQPQQTGTSGGQ